MVFLSLLFFDFGTISNTLIFTNTTVVQSSDEKNKKFLLKLIKENDEMNGQSIIKR